MEEVLQLFDVHTAEWFRDKIGVPTKVQEEAWPAIKRGDHTLISAPTGTGKTLSAFLVFIDALKMQARTGLKNELHLIYVSPLKSLAGDIRANLTRPLMGIYEKERSTGEYPYSTPFDIQVAIRTGDTPQDERRRMANKPPHILITTPESLYLLLTSKTGQGMLKTAKAIIIDELHAMIDSKRGAHLMFSLARLDKLCDRKLQRIGLSATMKPLSLGAKYLSMDPVTIVTPSMKKKIEIHITSPVASEEAILQKPVWVGIAQAVYKQCEDARTVIAFVEGRAYAEKLAYYVNQIGGEDFARTHHGSLSKEHRLVVEQELREGSIKLLCATSSMELGIDVGEVDKVFQIGTPRSISSTMQRLGRAGHRPDQTSVMHIFPRTVTESLYSGLTAEIVNQGGIEHAHPPMGCLDVLAQHLVSMATGDGYTIDEVLELSKETYSFHHISREDIEDILGMLAGDYEHDQNRPVRPRVLYDRIHGKILGDAYSRMLAVSAGGTIPDMGMYSIKTEAGVKVGELDEEYVYEARIGDKFLMGSFPWQIQKIEKDSVIVSASTMIGVRPPFYRGEAKGRPMETGYAFGQLFEELEKAIDREEGEMYLRSFGLDKRATKQTEEFLNRQIRATKGLPSHKRIIIEHYKDETGNHQMMVHSLFGKRVNGPLAILCSHMAKQRLRTNVNFVENDDGFLLFPYGEEKLPEGILYQIDSKKARKKLEAMVLTASIFHMTFRYNAGRAMMMGVRKQGRMPLWVQRLRSAQLLDTILRYPNHPLIRETKRECLEDYWDLPGVEKVLEGIACGEIEVEELYMDFPSPMSLPFRLQTEAKMMYDHAPAPEGVYRIMEDSLQESEGIEPLQEFLEESSQRTWIPENEHQLHSLLMAEGDIIAGEIPVAVEYLERLASDGRVSYIEPGLWIAKEHEDSYHKALQTYEAVSLRRIIARLLRYRGEYSEQQIKERYLIPAQLLSQVLRESVRDKEIILHGELYYHKDLFEKARRNTIKSRRSQIRTMGSNHYAALQLLSLQIIGSPLEQLEQVLKELSFEPYSIPLWETILLPSRVKGYRPELLDQILGNGLYQWRVSEESMVTFYPVEAINYDIDISWGEHVEDNEERLLLEALNRRGASFMSSLSSVLSGLSPHQTLLSLVKKGFVCCDSFLTIRQLEQYDKVMKSTSKVRAGARAKAAVNGRFELCRPLRSLSVDDALTWNFDRVRILCRENIKLITWSMALERLRILEYTGQVRRGYYVEGLSGIQFIREEDFYTTVQSLEHIVDATIWVSAVEPRLPWGKELAHMEGRSFTRNTGTVVCIRSGVPVAVLERQGKCLRLFQEDVDISWFTLFVEMFRRKQIYGNSTRIVVKEYPQDKADMLRTAGFIKEMMDYVLYR